MGICPEYTTLTFGADLGKGQVVGWWDGWMVYLQDYTKNT